MSGLTKKLSYMLSSGLDRIVLTLINDDVTGFIDEETSDQLIQILDNKSQKYARQEGQETLLKYARKVMTWQSALRTLMIFHKLTHMQGESFRDFLIHNKIDALSNFHVPKSPVKLFVHSAMVPHYHKYLQKLSYNYDDLRVCFFPDGEFPKRLQENNMSLFHFLSKIQNIIKYLLFIFPLLEVSLTKFGETDLIKQVTYFCLTDCYYYYTYITHTISLTIGEIFNLPEQDAIFLFELYCENILITKQLKAMFQLKIYLEEFYIKAPDFYVVDPELNKKIEIYMNSVKKGTAKVPEVKKPSKPGFKSKLEIDVNAEEDPELSQKFQSSLHGLSNGLSHILNQITTPNFNKAAQKTDLFKPPIAHKSANNIGSPRIRIISPAGNVQDGMKILSDGTKGSKPISDFNPFTAIRSANRERVFGNGAVEYKALGTSSPIGSPNESMSDSYVIARNNSK